jgi:hypothetical protein
MPRIARCPMTSPAPIIREPASPLTAAVTLRRPKRSSSRPSKQMARTLKR